MRYEVTKGEAEKILQFADELKAHGMTFMGYSIGRKCYTREFFEAVRDRGGFVIHQNSARIPLALAMGRKRVISFLFSFSPISKIFSEI